MEFKEFNEYVDPESKDYDIESGIKADNNLNTTDPTPANISLDIPEDTEEWLENSDISDEITEIPEDIYDDSNGAKTSGFHR